jgi:hypothetical protein
MGNEKLILLPTSKEQDDGRSFAYTLPWNKVLDNTLAFIKFGSQSMATVDCKKSEHLLIVKL